MQAIEPCTSSLKNRLAAALRNKWYNYGFFDAVMRHNAMDYSGINYYSRQLVDARNWGIASLAMDTCKEGHHPVKKNSLGWDIYPEGLFNLLVGLKKYGLPVIIMENGICTSDDGLRWEFISAHLKNVRLAMDAGVDVKGYLYWSLMDNFEWDKGFGPRFGLLDVDYKTYARSIRKSAEYFGEVCKTGVLD
jgi:beta-glucosidase